jgi:hypothetical protein
LADQATTKIVKAADAFLGTLDEKQRQAVLYRFDDNEQRARWSNFPIAMVRRGGISLKEMNEEQRTAAMEFLSAVLSARGFEKVKQIMEGDQMLTMNQGGGGRGPGGEGKKGDGAGKRGGGGGGAMFGKELYFFSILGKPSETEPWMLQFGGHHLALNISIAGEQDVLTPSLTGAQPSLFTLNGATIRPLGQESYKALDLLNSLDDEQRKKAILDYRVGDLVLGPGKDGKTIQPEGLKASEMNAGQKARLLDLMAEYAGIVQESAAKLRLAELRAGLDETWFAWSGPTKVESGRNISAYYRIQGPKVVIEYAPQGGGPDSSLHVHAMYRDPTNDYGRSPTKQ